MSNTVIRILLEYLVLETKKKKLMWANLTFQSEDVLLVINSTYNSEVRVERFKFDT